MADVTIKSQLEGLAKEVYGEGPENLIPDHARLVKEIPFRESEMLGNSYNVPVIVSDENGVTYADSEDDAFTLEDPEAMQTKNASVKGSQIVLRAAIGYKAAAAIASKGPKAFLNSTELVIKRLMEQAGKRLEASLLYGGSGLGQVSSVTADDATHEVITFSAATWAPGIWIGSQNAKIDIYDSAGVIVNSTSAFKVTNVDVASRSVTVEGVAGDITALDGQAGGDFPLDVFYRGAKDNEMLGLDGIITTSGELFGIDNEVYHLFKGRTFSASNAALTFDKLSHAIVEPINFGLKQDVDVLVSPKTWQNLNQSEAALRQYDYSYKSSKGEKGNNDLVYHNQGLAMRIVPHSMIKEGEAFMLPMKELRRCGAYDLSMRNPGRNNEMFRELESRSGFELRAYTDQALFCDHPSWLLKITGITNS